MILCGAVVIYAESAGSYDRQDASRRVQASNLPLSSTRWGFPPKVT